MKHYTIRELVRPNILNLKPYSSARNEFEGEAELFLDANENWRDFIGGRGRNRYPDPLHKEVRERIKEVFGFDQSNVMVGSGSDEIIDLLFRIFCEPLKDKALLISPTYGAYEVFAHINNVDVSHCLLKEDFTLNLQKMETVCDLVKRGSIEKGMHKLLFICSPNNPTGNSFPLKQIEMIVQNFEGVVVVDEAYIDYAEQISATTLLPKYPRLIILRTFSKAWGLANVRVGFAVAHKEIIDFLYKVKYPYNLSGVAQELVLEVLAKADEVKQGVEETKKERQLMIDTLKSYPFVEHIYPSDANFLLVRVSDPLWLMSELQQRGIIIRNRSSVRGCYQSVRITVGSKEENQILYKALDQIKEE